MPSSRYEHISDAVSIILALSPQAFLDVGCGFGRWGFLAREFLDIFQGRYEKTAWLTQIDAIEVFSDYICPHHAYIYDKILLGKVEDYIGNLPRYDVIFAGDVIEHLEKIEGESILLGLKSKCARALIVALPLGKQWPQDAVFGNPYESHKSVWTEADLRRLGAKYVKLYRVDDRPYALAIWTSYVFPQLERRSKRLLSMCGRLIRRLTG
ncbi:hypothetical protein [uncultured Thiodictyon sp.]|jgi:SAM-dependent methyltransferase|uniref:hypothetical protein n=1 Tax=uncultured Thiodictyon sp. TaxID=1846217 RepID=UPI0025F13BEF|nr:hypothetical protein [uncultured Thiodictyon sp.]